MKSIFMISPDFLEVSYKEALKYDFTLQGYGNFVDGKNGLLKINRQDLLGFVYFATSLPENLEELMDFLHYCDLMGNNSMFLFALLNTKGLSAINLTEFSNLCFAYLGIEEVVTDKVLNRDIFGTILLQNYEPYTFEEEKSEVPSVFSVERLQYRPIFSNYVLQCLSKVNLSDSFEKTVAYDEVYQNYSKDNELLAEIRKFYIETFFHDSIDNSYLFELIDQEDGSLNYGMYKALINLVSKENAIKE